LLSSPYNRLRLRFPFPSLSSSLLNGDHAHVYDPGGNGFNNRVEGTSTHDDSSNIAGKGNSNNNNLMHDPGGDNSDDNIGS